MTERKAHYLVRTKGAIRPGHIIFVDTETRPLTLPDGEFRNSLRIGHALYARSRRGEPLRIQRDITFTDPGEFWSWAETAFSPKRRVYLVAHNLHFDLPVLHAFGELYSRGFELGQLYSQGMTNLFRWKGGNCHLIAVDNGNLFPGPLAEWGEALGLPKLPVDPTDATDDELLPYLRRDVEILYRLWRDWLEFLDLHDLGSFKTTIASTAFNAYRHRFMPRSIHIHTNELALELEKDAYHGGRAEVFFQGERHDGPFYMLDFNSMYGDAMLTHEYPLNIRGSTGPTTVKRLAHLLKNNCCIALVALKVDEPVFPFVTDERTIYPIGRFISTLSTPELSYALERGWVKKVLRMAWYRPLKLFDQYVEYFWKVRQHYQRQDNEAMARVIKLLINALYGKFAQYNVDQGRVGYTSVDDIRRELLFNHDTKRLYELLYIGGSIIQSRRADWAYHSFPAIAAHVTAYARMKLWDTMQKVPEGSLLYVDTDSLLVNRLGYESLTPLIETGGIGDLKIEAASEWVDVRAPKDYSMNGRERIKGVRDDAQRVGKNTYKQIEWRRLRGMVQKGDLDGHRSYTVVKRLDRIVRSGRLTRSGWVRPFRRRDW